MLKAFTSWLAGGGGPGGLTVNVNLFIGSRPVEGTPDLATTILERIGARPNESIPAIREIYFELYTTGALDDYWGPRIENARLFEWLIKRENHAGVLIGSSGDFWTVCDILGTAPQYKGLDAKDRTIIGCNLQIYARKES
jgi:hypothetical protein